MKTLRSLADTIAVQESGCRHIHTSVPSFSLPAIQPCCRRRRCAPPLTLPHAALPSCALSRAGLTPLAPMLLTSHTVPGRATTAPHHRHTHAHTHTPLSLLSTFAYTSRRPAPPQLITLPTPFAPPTPRLRRCLPRLLSTACPAILCVARSPPPCASSHILHTPSSHTKPATSASCVSGCCIARSARTVTCVAPHHLYLFTNLSTIAGSAPALTNTPHGNPLHRVLIAINSTFARNVVSCWASSPPHAPSTRRPA